MLSSVFFGRRKRTGGGEASSAKAAASRTSTRNRSSRDERENCRRRFYSCPLLPTQKWLWTTRRWTRQCWLLVVPVIFHFLVAAIQNSTAHDKVSNTKNPFPFDRKELVESLSKRARTGSKMNRQTNKRKSKINAAASTTYEKLKFMPSSLLMCWCSINFWEMVVRVRLFQYPRRLF